MPDQPFHPDLRRAARFLPRHLVGERSLSAIRSLESLGGLGQPPRDVTVESTGTAEVRLHLPPGAPVGQRPAVLWIHGGGHVIGQPSQDDAVCRELARRLGAVVAAVRYRRSPEDPYPAALEDCHEALVWLAGRADVDAGRVVVAGASAGGGLAAALAILAVERGEVRPTFQLLVYPMLDDRTTSRTGPPDRDMRVWDERSNRFGWRSYLGREPGGAGVEATAAPARIEDPADLPPAWIGVGTRDLFHDEDVAYAELLRSAGVPCDLVVVPGAFHGFDSIVPNAPVTRRFRDSMVRAVAANLGVPDADAVDPFGTAASTSAAGSRSLDGIDAARLRELVDRQEIDALLSRYATAIDTHDWDALDRVFAPDAHLDYRAAGGIDGAYPEVKAWLAEVLPAMFEATQHLVVNREIDIDGDVARSRSVFQNPSRHRVGGEVRTFTCGGTYHDRLERGSDGWRIVRRVEDVVWWTDPLPGLPDVPPGLPDGVVLP